MAVTVTGRDMPAAGIALTKFRVPRVRGDAIAREALLARLRASVETHALTVVVAPAGYGKTTALAQLAASLRDAALVWISLDEDDDDPNRLFASLVRALQPLDLQFEAEPSALVASAGAGGTQGRAAIGALVNALCTCSAPRIVVIVDDLHRVHNDQVAPLLEALVERLPGHVSLVLAGRSLPPLPIARWIIHGEAEEFGPAALGFDAAEATALAAVRLGDRADPARIARLLERTHGWAAGLAMLLRAPSQGDGTGPDADLRLFEYLASEVLEGLPAELQHFVIDVAVLGELTPQACAAVTGRGDAALMLRELHDRDLFVTVLDARRPALRFHDLFRDFLLGRLQSDPGRLRELHVRAAGAERSYSLALHHWIAAGEWSAALARLLDAADELFAEGGHAAVERWLERFAPGVVDREPAWHYLRGVCAWRRWDWFRSRDALERAAELLSESTPMLLRARILLYLMGSRSGLGDSDGAARLADSIRTLALEDSERAAFALLCAWSSMGRGDGERVVAELRTAVAILARDPRGIAPSTADRAHSIYIGLPGALGAYRDMLEAYSAARGPALAPWQGAPAIIGGWTALWEGDRARARAAMDQAHDIMRQFGGIPPLQDGLTRLESIYLAVTGQGAAGLQMVQQLVTRFDSASAEPLRIAFEGAYVHTWARVAWASGDPEAFRRIAARAARPPRPQEWAFVAVAARAVPAQLALLDRDWARAAEGFESLLGDHARLRCPMGHADPRLGLAHARLQQGRLAESLAALEPVLRECAAEQSIGLLLLEPRWLVAPLLASLPATHRADPALAPLLARLRDWWDAADAPPLTAARDRASGPLATLSEREREVLERVADGASNKEIARDLDLSPHTVKRHIANVLGKLDCISRRQAADLLRKARPPDEGAL